VGAGSGWKAWARERLTVGDLQHLIQDQTVMAFDSNAAMDAAMPGSERAPGHVTYVRDAGRFYGQYADGSRFAFGRFLGVLSAWPTSGTVNRGDFFYSIPHQCHFVAGASAVGWQQVETPSVNGIAGRSALAAAVAAAGMALPDGFLVYAYGLERIYMWNRSQWRLLGGNPGSTVTLTTGTGAPQTGWTGAGWTGYLQHHGNGMATVYVEVIRSGANLAMSSSGAVPQSDVMLLPPGWETRHPTVLTSGIAGRGAHGHMSAGGRTMILTAVTGTLAIQTGETISLGATYALANPQDLAS
jgi:hypothetical protein